MLSVPPPQRVASSARAKLRAAPADAPNPPDLGAFLSCLLRLAARAQRGAAHRARQRGGGWAHRACSRRRRVLGAARRSRRPCMRRRGSRRAAGAPARARGLGAHRPAAGASPPKKSGSSSLPSPDGTSPAPRRGITAAVTPARDVKRATTRSRRTRERTGVRAGHKELVAAKRGWQQGTHLSPCPRDQNSRRPPPALAQLAAVAAAAPAPRCAAAPPRRGAPRSSMEPREAAAIAAVLRAQGAPAWEPRVVAQLLEFSYRHVADVLDGARQYAAHRSRDAPISLADVRLAAQSNLANTFTEPLAGEELARIVAPLNAVPLPALTQRPGLAFPAEGTLLAPNFQARARPGAARPAACHSLTASRRASRTRACRCFSRRRPRLHAAARPRPRRPPRQKRQPRRTAPQPSACRRPPRSASASTSWRRTREHRRTRRFVYREGCTELSEGAHRASPAAGQRRACCLQRRARAVAASHASNTDCSHARPQAELLTRARASAFHQRQAATGQRQHLLPRACTRATRATLGGGGAHAARNDARRAAQAVAAGAPQRGVRPQTKHVAQGDSTAGAAAC
jgi:transcription initiation factor TFIID subunit 9B